MGPVLPGAMEPPELSIGTPEEYEFWRSRRATFLGDRGGEADELGQPNSRLDYKGNRITIYRLADPSDERSVVETISHEILHALLYQTDELRAARAIDIVARPPGHPDRVGGI
jgi:hypothetical protein